MTSTLRDELAELYQRSDRALEEAHKLHEDYCFIVSWLTTRPAPSARYTSLLNENGNDAQHATFLQTTPFGALRVH